MKSRTSVQQQVKVSTYVPLQFIILAFWYSIVLLPVVKKKCKRLIAFNQRLLSLGASQWPSVFLNIADMLPFQFLLHTPVDCAWRNLTGSCPLVLGPMIELGSRTLVRKASFPSLVHPIHVPPPRSSLPPRISLLSSCAAHHCAGCVGLVRYSSRLKSKSRRCAGWHSHAHAAMHMAEIQPGCSV